VADVLKVLYPDPNRDLNAVINQHLQWLREAIQGMGLKVGDVEFITTQLKPDQWRVRVSINGSWWVVIEDTRDKVLESCRNLHRDVANGVRHSAAKDRDSNDPMLAQAQSRAAETAPPANTLASDEFAAYWKRLITLGIPATGEPGSKKAEDIREWLAAMISERDHLVMATQSRTLLMHATMCIDCGELFELETKAKDGDKLREEIARLRSAIERHDARRKNGQGVEYPWDHELYTELRPTVAAK